MYSLIFLGSTTPLTDLLYIEAYTAFLAIGIPDIPAAFKNSPRRSESFIIIGAISVLHFLGDIAFLTVLASENGTPTCSQYWASTSVSLRLKSPGIASLASLIRSSSPLSSLFCVSSKLPRLILFTSLFNESTFSKLRGACVRVLLSPIVGCKCFIILLSRAVPFPNKSLNPEDFTY